MKFKVRSLLRNNPRITREEIGIQIRKNKRTVQRIANGGMSKGYVLRLVPTDSVNGRF
ncbi:MAG: hypothetical protein SPG64_00230 [Candidatus Enteromonas sp.]|nr:hypothetical protein [Candidatus Enteromonas sp.]